jgi:hypothetical protein
MSYRMIEELQSRKKEKVAMFLTFENIIGLVLFGFPGFVVSTNMPLLIRVPCVAGAALLGVFLTLETQGLPIYERLLWRARGAIRIRTRGGLIRPEDLAGAVRPTQLERALARDGPIRLAQRPTHRRSTRQHVPVPPPLKGVSHGNLSTHELSDRTDQQSAST